MIPNSQTALFNPGYVFAPYIPLQTTPLLYDGWPTRKEFLNMRLSDKICITNWGVYIVLDIHNVGSWVKVSWLLKSGEIVKRKYEI